MDVEGVVLDEWPPLALLDQFVEGAEDWAVWGDVVENAGHWVSLALYHHMLDIRFMPAGWGKNG